MHFALTLFCTGSENPYQSMGGGLLFRELNMYLESTPKDEDHSWEVCTTLAQRLVCTFDLQNVQKFVMQKRNPE